MPLPFEGESHRSWRPSGRHLRPAGAASRLRHGPHRRRAIVVAPSWIASVAVIVALGVPVITQVVPGTGTGVAIVVSIVLGVLLGASVLAHESGHCLAARALGMQVVGVRLYLLGGVSELERAPRSPREEAVIAAAGPAVSAVLAGVFWLAVQAVDRGTVELAAADAARVVEPGGGAVQPVAGAPVGWRSGASGRRVARLGQPWRRDHRRGRRWLRHCDGADRLGRGDDRRCRDGWSAAGGDCGGDGVVRRRRRRRRTDGPGECAVAR